MKVQKSDGHIIEVTRRSDLLEFGLEEYISNRTISKEEATSEFILEVIKELMSSNALTDSEVLSICQLGHWEITYHFEDK